MKNVVTPSLRGASAFAATMAIVFLILADASCTARRDLLTQYCADHEDACTCDGGSCCIEAAQPCERDEQCCSGECLSVSGSDEKVCAGTAKSDAGGEDAGTDGGLDETDAGQDGGVDGGSCELEPCVLDGGCPQATGACCERDEHCLSGQCTLGICRDATFCVDEDGACGDVTDCCADRACAFGKCTNQICPPFLTECCTVQWPGCEFVNDAGTFYCAAPGTLTTSNPCCYDRCPNGDVCDCQVTGSCVCTTEGSCSIAASSYLCPL